jgi:hypothetical protein
MTVFAACNSNNPDNSDMSPIGQQTVSEVISESGKHPWPRSFRQDKPWGTEQVAGLWRESDGTAEDFKLSAPGILFPKAMSLTWYLTGWQIISKTCTAT